MSKADEIIKKIKYEVSAGEYSTIKTKDLEEILNYIDNSISKEVIKEKIKKLKKCKDITPYGIGKLEGLYELLEGK